MADNIKCEHDACNCQTMNSSDYCSSQCETAAEQHITAISCECGHAGCGDAV